MLRAIYVLWPPYPPRHSPYPYGHRPLPAVRSRWHCPGFSALFPLFYSFLWLSANDLDGSPIVECFQVFTGREIPVVIRGAIDLDFCLGLVGTETSWEVETTMGTRFQGMDRHWFTLSLG